MEYEVQFIIEMPNGINMLTCPLFCIDIPKSEVENVKQAVNGEWKYNGMFENWEF